MRAASFFKNRLIQSLGVTTLALGGLAACAGNDEVGPGEVRTSYKALSGPINGKELHGLNGSYTNCVSHTGDWSVAVNGYSLSSLPNPQLAVVVGDPGCQLTLKSVVFDTTTYTASSSSGLPITGTYQSTGMGFGDGLGTDPDFYANIKMTPADFSTNFDIDFVYSSDVNFVSQDVNSTYANVTPLVFETQVPAPNYILGLGGASIQVNFDNEIVSVSGTANFSLPLVNPQAGQKYLIVNSFVGGGPTDIGAVQATFDANVLNQEDITTDPFLVNIGSFLGDGEIVPTTKYMIIRNLQVVNGENIASYQVFQITFEAP